MTFANVTLISRLATTLKVHVVSSSDSFDLKGLGTGYSYADQWIDFCFSRTNPHLQCPYINWLYQNYRGYVTEHSGVCLLFITRS